MSYKDYLMPGQQASIKKEADDYGPLKTENVRVGTKSDETPESILDAKGATALKKNRKKGGRVEGDKPKMRLDRIGRARGGKVAKKGTTVNVIIAPQGGAGQQPPQKVPVPVPVPSPGAGPMVPPHPPMAGPPMGGAMPPPGLGAPGMSMGRARGGSVRRADGGPIDPPDPNANNSNNSNEYANRAYQSQKDQDRNRGGSVRRANGGKVDMDYGAGGGLGRLEKAKEYGKNSKSGEGKAIKA